MNEGLKSVVCQAVCQSGLLPLAMRLSERRSANGGGRFQILVYHRIGATTDPFTSAMSARGFARQMQALRAHFRVLSLSDLLLAAERREVPAHAVAVTFDDGYEDTLTHALPILQRYQIPATVYLATGLMDTDQSMWNDRIGAAVRDTTRAELQPICDGMEPMPLRTATERRSALQRTLEALKRRALAERARLADRVVEQLDGTAESGPRMLRWEQVRQLHAGGIEVGAHTVTHPILTAVSADDARREITEAKAMIEARLQAPVRHFAYPNGTEKDFDAETKSMVRAAGYVSAVTTMFGANDPSTDRYALRRGGPWEEDSATFATKLWWYRCALPVTVTRYSLPVTPYR